LTVPFSHIVTILRRDRLNEAGFKKLFVMPDKKIFSNLNLPAIADLDQNTLIYAIKRELKEGTYWKLLRKDVAPCADCPFQLLCPPVSNYDFALNRHNLCTIWEKEK
jgi:pseudo-rSAM protein